MFRFRSGELEFSPRLFIFDKDGTLIDFNSMWASWVSELGQRLERATRTDIAPELYARMGYDAARHTVIAASPLAAHSMASLRDLTLQVAHSAGLSFRSAERAVDDAWFVPDPVKLAHPVADLPRVLSALREQNILVGVATSDDRAPTLESLHALGILSMVDALVSADDGLANKPAPDMLLRVCTELNVAPAKSVMVGDGIADMLAGRAAYMGACIGVLSGLTPRAELEPLADAVIENIEALIN